jgi:hypothetical protein
MTESQEFLAKRKDRQGRMAFLLGESGVPGVKHFFLGYQRKWAKALLASAILWVSSRFFTAAPR